jgi:hypothetical protein
MLYSTTTRIPHRLSRHTVPATALPCLQEGMVTEIQRHRVGSLPLAAVPRVPSVCLSVSIVSVPSIYCRCRGNHPPYPIKFQSIITPCSKTHNLNEKKNKRPPR